MFRATSRLLDCRITLFTRTPCGLCDTAKAVVHNVKSQRAFQYQEINVMEAGQETWKSVYEYDTPVVRFVRKYREVVPESSQIHIDQVAQETTTSSPKLMHRFKEEDVVKLMDDAERA
jgi:glutaredoxin